MQVKYPKIHCSRPHRLFLLNKCSSDCCKSLVNFKVLKKLMLTAFCQFSHFCGRVDFWRSLLRHPCVPLQTEFLRSDHSIIIGTQLICESAFLPIRMAEIQKKDGCREIDTPLEGR